MGMDQTKLSGQAKAAHGSNIYENAMGHYFVGFSEQKGEKTQMRSVKQPNEEHGKHKSKKNQHDPSLPVGVPQRPPGEAHPFVLETKTPHPDTHSADGDDAEAFKARVNQCTQTMENLAEHVKFGQSMSDTVKGKLALGVNIAKKGGKEKLFKEQFQCSEGEKLLKGSVCYLSTSTFPIAGLLFISTKKLAFCSDRPLAFTCPSGGVASSYYKVAIPIKKISFVTPCENTDKPAEKYIRVQTTDNYEFWFMGFVNYNKAYKRIQEAKKADEETMKSG